MKRPARLAFCSLLFVIAAPLGAQSASSETAVPNRDTTASVATIPEVVQPIAAAAAQPVSVAGAPTLGLRAGVHAQETTRPSAPTMAAAHANLGQARAMMGVGVAGLIVGAIIGGTPGTVIMVAGAVIGLKGLYDYLQ